MNLYKHFEEYLNINPEEIPKNKGLYSIYFKEKIIIDRIPFKGIIYLGKSQSGIYKRLIKTHINPTVSKKAINSTFRRTLGSLLKDELKLKVIPRNRHKTIRTKLDNINYQFDETSEKRLSHWIQKNCGVNYYTIEDIPTIKKTEKEMIHYFKPPFNLSDNFDHELSNYISMKRNVCREIAEMY